MGRQPVTVKAQIADLRRWNRTLVKSVQQLAIEVSHHSEVIDQLNGSVGAIHQIKDIAPTLVRLSQQLNPDIVGQVVALASQQKEHDDWWAGTRRRLTRFSPLKPVGAGFWTIALGLIVWGIGSRIFG